MTALALIRVGMSRLAFVYDSELRWRLKYTMAVESRGLATPSKEDLERFNEVLVNPVAPTLDLAMGWYNAGRNASDPFTGFLCYFNAIEAVTEGVWEGDLEFSSGPMQRQSRSERLAWRRQCMQRAQTQHFPHDPVGFAQEVYFGSLQQLAKRRRDVAERIWGPTHWVIGALFDSATPPDCSPG